MDRTDATLPAILSHRAASTPDRTFLQHVDGALLTFAGLESLVHCWMATLAAQGVGQGNRVVVMLPVSFDAVAAWLAIARLGALQVAINTGYVGNLLRHVIADSAAEHIVFHARFAGALSGVTDQVPHLRQAIVVGGRAGLPDFRFAAAELAAVADPADTVPLAGSDIASVIYTSGTTGPSKGVLVTWRQAIETSRWCMPPEDMRPDDAWYCPWPYYHVSGQLGLISAAVTGTRLVIRDGFSTTRFWPEVREHGCTAVLLPGTTLSYLANLPLSTEDRTHPLRNVLAAPLPRNAAEIAARFGIRFRTMFNMTEVSCPIVSDWTATPTTGCGTVRPGATCRIVDDTDHEVPPGAVGELIVRCDRPWEMMAGYLNRPDATVAAWRNLWFHTGDAFRQDADGQFVFVDRMKHTIRRGGENISSSELEEEVCLFPPVAECAAIGVPAQHGEEDVKVFVVPKPGAGFEPAGLLGFLDGRVPRFMLPRYVVTMDALPKTNTHRAKKEELRALPDGPATWDRQAQGASRSRR